MAISLKKDSNESMALQNRFRLELKLNHRTVLRIKRSAVLNMAVEDGSGMEIQPLSKLIAIS